MAENKTRENDASVEDFIASVDDERRRADAQSVLAMMQEATGRAPKMWGANIVGFGRYSYRYASGRSGEWMRIGLSPRKRNLTLYIMSGFDSYDALMARLGKHRTGKSCLYINKLADVDAGVLRELIDASLAHMDERYGAEPADDAGDEAEAG